MKVGDKFPVTIKGTFLMSSGDLDYNGNTPPKEEIKSWFLDALGILLEKPTITFGPAKSKKATVRKK